EMDPLCLVHGVFFAEKANVLPGQPKIARAITALVEAEDVHPVNSGGVKRDVVLHSAGEGTKSDTGYGSIPFHRQEFTARSVTLRWWLFTARSTTSGVSIDRLQFRSYGLGDDVADLLAVIALCQVRSFLDRGLRRRTTCDLDPVAAPDGLPTVDELGGRIPVG